MAVQDLAALGHQLLRHRQAETRHHSAVDLTLMRQRVDDGTHIVGCDHLDHLDLTGLPVHFYLSDLRAEIHDVFWLRGIVLDGNGQGKVGAVLNRLPHLRTRLHYRVTFRVGDSAGPRTFVEGRAVGVALTHPYPGQRDVHLGGHDLLLNGMGTRADIHRRTE